MLTAFVITLILGIYLGAILPFYMGKLISYFQNRKILKEVMPTEVDEIRLCRTNHSWIQAPLWDEKGESKIGLCQICGFIPKLNQMVSSEAIDRIQENNKIRQIEAQIYKDFLLMENGDIRKYFDAELKNGVSFEKLAYVHDAGMTFGARFNKYKSQRAGEIEKALNRTDA